MKSKISNLFIGCLFVVFCEILFGLSYVFTKEIPESITILTLLSWRFIIAFVVINVCVLMKIIKINFKGKKLITLFKIVIFQPIIYYIAETLGIRLTTSSESGVILAAIPVATIIFSTLILKEKPSKKQIIGICITMIGVVVCVLAKGIKTSFNSIGYIILFIAVISYGLYSVFVQKAKEYSSAEKSYAMIMSGFIFFTTLAIIQNILKGTIGEFLTLPYINIQFLFVILYTGIGCSFLAVVLYNQAISKIGTNTVTSFVGISTIVSILAGVVLLKETFSIVQIIGTILVLVGVYVANKIRNTKNTKLCQ